MIERIIIAGAGGQGIMLMGKVLTAAGLENGYRVSLLPTYGAEVRGGAACCMVNISSEDIPFPYINKADSLIIMNVLSLLKFKQRVKNKGLLLINSSLINNNTLSQISAGQMQIPADIVGKCARIRALPFTETAIALGNIKVANMVALGAYITQKGIVAKQVIFSAMEEFAPREKKGLLEINRQAIEKGMGLVE